MRFIIPSLLFIFIYHCVCAETVTLKSGQVIEGEITEKTGNYIKVKTNFSDTALIYFLDEVKNIESQKTGETKKESPSPEPPTVISESKIDAKDLFGKVRVAIKSQKIFQIKSTIKMDMPGMTNTETEAVINMDLENKKIAISQQIKDMKVSFERQIKDAVIQKAQKDGLPTDKIEQMRQSLEAMSAQTQQMLGEMVTKMKSIVTKVYLIDNLMYMNVSDKWVKMEKPLLKDIWRLYSLAEEKAGDKDDLKKALSGSSYLNDAINPFLDLEEDDLFEVTEGEYSGIDCYVIDIKDNKFFDKMKYAIIAVMKSQGSSRQGSFDPEKLIFDSMSFKQYISKKDYLPLSSVTESLIHYSLGQSMGSIDTLQIRIARDDSWFFPGQEIILPQEAQGALLVNSEEEAKQILFGDLLSIQKSPPVK